MSAQLQTPDRVQAHGKEALRRGSRSFNAAASLLDPVTRDSARLLYAWCRHCDDVVDGQEMGFAKVRRIGSPAQRLAVLRRATMAAHAGERQDNPVFAAFQRVVQRHDIPLELPLALLDGFRMDVEGRRYQTSEDTIDYCYHVAGVVGLMMARIMGVKDEATLDRACDLGIAFQLTNIARDVVEDWRNGRVYLPESLLDKVGIPVEELGEPQQAARLATLVGQILDLAETYYQSARVGIDALPFRAAWAIEAAHRIYRAIGVKVARSGVEAWSRRIVTPAPEKLMHGAAAMVSVLGRSARRTPQPRPATLWRRPRLG